jgi:hypothetical protein
MATYKPFLGETQDRNAAFPQFESFTLTVSQDPYSHYRHEDWIKTSTYDKSNINRYERCLNPRCQQGGLDLQQVVSFYGDGEHTFYCRGHEGTPKGRRVGDPCENVFKVTLSSVRT